MALLDAIERMSRRFDEIERLMADPEVAAAAQRMTALLKERGAIEPKVEAYRRWRRVEHELDGARKGAAAEADPELKALFENEIPDLEAKLAEGLEELRELFVADDDRGARSAILEIRAGTGGDEAALFAGDLLEMYTRYAASKGWKTEIMDLHEGGAGGVREVVVNIIGDRVYKHLQFESGTHRVQRVPATEAQGRIHTSAATVAVLPEANEVDVDIRNEDLRIDTFCASGPGGQKVNKTASAIRITHVPTGTVVQCQDEKSQHKNKARALKILASRIYEVQAEKEHAARAAIRKSQVGSGDRSEKVRTYNFPQNRFTDHRINHHQHNLDQVMLGELDEVIAKLIEQDKEEKLRDLENQ